MDNVTLYHGDCLNIMQNITDKSIDLICCDLPFAVTNNDWDVLIPFDKMWAEYDRIIKDNGAIVLNCQQPFTSLLITSNLKDFKYCWTWYKKQCSGFLNAKKQPLRNCEDIAVFYKQQPTYNPQMRLGKMQLKATGSGSDNYGDYTYKPHTSEEYYPTTHLEIPLPRFKDGHPTQKPVELIEYLIKTYTNKGDVVLDNCMGSGTTAVACLNTGRKFIGIELDEKYFNMAKDRILKHIPSTDNISIDGEEIKGLNKRMRLL